MSIFITKFKFDKLQLGSAIRYAGPAVRYVGHVAKYVGFAGVCFVIAFIEFNMNAFSQQIACLNGILGQFVMYTRSLRLFKPQMRR